MARLSLILTLAQKDWWLFWSDKRAAGLCFAVPIILAASFGMVFHKPPGSSNAPTLPILVVAQSDDAFARSLVEDLLKSPRLEAELVTAEEAFRRVADRRPSVAVFLPSNVSELAGWNPLHLSDAEAKPPVQVLHNPLAESEGQWAEGVITEIIIQRIAKNSTGRWLNTERAMALPFEVKTQVLHGCDHEQFNSYTHSFSGMTLQYLLFWGMESGILLLRERQRSLWPRLRAAPVPLWCVLVAKACSTALIALLQVLVTFSFGYVVFGVTVDGSIVGFALLVGIVSMLAAATGLLVASLGGTEARARSVCILAILGVSMLGGLWLPSFVLPGWARDIAMALPTSWAMQGFDRMTWQGREFSAVAPSLLVLLGFTGFFLAFAVAKLVHSEARRRRGMV